MVEYCDLVVADTFYRLTQLKNFRWAFAKSDTWILN